MDELKWEHLSYIERNFKNKPANFALILELKKIVSVIWINATLNVKVTTTIKDGIIQHEKEYQEVETPHFNGI